MFQTTAQSSEVILRRLKISYTLYCLFDMTVAQLIRSARLEAGLSQAALARRLGTSQPAVARLEREGANPRVETLRRVMEANGRELRLTAEPTTKKPRARGATRAGSAERLEQLENVVAELDALRGR